MIPAHNNKERISSIAISLVGNIKYNEQEDKTE
jgi:hypothetical protein